MDTSASTQTDNNFNQLLSNKQNWLATKFDWPFLEQRWDLAAAAGSRYLSIPTSPNTPGGSGLVINFERPVLVEVYFNSFYHSLCEGIGSAQYNHLNSDNGVQMDPVQHWRFASNINDTTANRIEIWPIPASAQTIRFTGQRALNTLFSASNSAATNNALTADLDDLLLVLMVAAEYLASLQSPLASVKAQMAADRLQQLRAGYPQPCEPIVLGRPRTWNRQQRRVVPMIVVAP